ncbi:AAA family ATPase [Variovorax sp. RB3P1]|uniref:AAA family ATPase n=1 Tax=Variovorax sp. RB3P1 TaxID=3443732 RepID=UPI003F44E5EA
MLIDYMNMTSGDYHNKAVEYNMTGLIAEIKRMFPDEPNPDINNPKYKHIIADMPYLPLIAGGLSKSLGIKDEFLSLDLWKDLSNGYCPAAFLPKDSELARFAVDTPRGSMVKFNRTATPIDAVTGEYRPDLAPKKRRIGTEFVFGLARNTSNVLTALELADPSIEKRVTAEINRIFVEHIVPEMERDAFIKSGTDGVNLGYVQGLLVVSHHHTENRSEEAYKHWHFDVMNVANGEDGSLGSVTNDLIAKNKDKYNALFQMYTKDFLERELGLSFQPVYLDEDLKNEFLLDHQRNVTAWEVEDKFIPESLRNDLGARTKEIDALMKKMGVSGFIAEEIARKETRNEKTELSPSELKQHWKDTYAKHGFNAATIAKHQNFNQVKDPEAVLPTHEVLIDNFLRKHKEVSFSEDQFKAHIHKQLLGLCDRDRAERYGEEIFANECHQMMDKEQREYFADFLADNISDPELRKQKQLRFGRDVVFTTTSILKMDKYISESLQARVHETSFVLSKSDVMSAILKFEAEVTEKMKKEGKKDGFVFAAGQKNAIVQACCENGAAMNVAGMAGTGKSTLLNVVKSQYEAKGFRLVGTSGGQAATRNLAESIGMKKGSFFNTSELLKLIEVDKFKLDSKTVLLVDEAGMLATSELYQVIQHANKAGAKLILCGDKLQLQPVGFGGNFRILNEEITTAPVTEINRQREDWQREMVHDFAGGRAHVAIDKLYKNGKVVIKKTDKGRLTQLVHDYVSDTNKAQDKIILAMTNQDTEKLNSAVREELKAKGHLSKEEVTVKGKDGIDREFAVGDRLIFFKNQKSDNVEQAKLSNSDTGKVRSISRYVNGKPHSIQLEMDDGSLHHLSLTKEQNIKHGYAVTTHKSQGQTKENAYFWVSPTLNNLHAAYVACSRHKGSLKLYLSEDMVETLAQKMEGKAPTQAMAQLAQSVAKKKKLELPPATLKSFIDTREWLDANHKPSDPEKVKVRSVLDDFKSVFEAMAQTAFKKTTYDYDLADGAAQNAYKEVRLQRMHRGQPVPEFVGPLQPVHQVDQPAASKSLKPNLTAIKTTVTNMAKKAVDALASLNPAFKKPPVLESEIHVEKVEPVAIKPTKDLKPEVAAKKKEIKKKNTLSL